MGSGSVSDTATKVNVISSQDWPPDHPLEGITGSHWVALSSAAALLPHKDGCVIVWPNGATMLVEDSLEEMISRI